MDFETDNNLFVKTQGEMIHNLEVRLEKLENLLLDKPKRERKNRKSNIVEDKTAKLIVRSVLNETNLLERENFMLQCKRKYNAKESQDIDNETFNDYYQNFETYAKDMELIFTKIIKILN